MLNCVKKLVKGLFLPIVFLSMQPVFGWFGPFRSKTEQEIASEKALQERIAAMKKQIKERMQARSVIQSVDAAEWIFKVPLSFAGRQEWDELDISTILNGRFEKTRDNDEEQGILVQKPLIQPFTMFGSYGLFKMLNPITDFELLKKRQAFLKQVHDDSSSYAEMKSLLEAIKKDQKSILSYFASQEEKFHELYWTQPKTFLWLFDLPKIADLCNQNPTLMNLSLFSTIGGIASSLVGVQITQGIIEMVYNGMGGTFVKTDQNANETIKSSFKNAVIGMLSNGLRLPFTVINPFIQSDVLKFLPQKNSLPLSYCLQMLLSLNSSFGDKIDMLKRGPAIGILGSEGLQAYHGFAGTKRLEKYGSWMPTAAAATLALPFQIYAGYQVYHIYKSMVDRLKSYKTNMQKMHKKMIKVARLIKNMEKLQELAVKFGCPDLVAQVTHSDDYTQVMKDLHSGTFDGTSALYNRGKMLIAHKKLAQLAHNGELTWLFQNLATVDSYISVLEFMKTNNSNGNPVCFVDFVEDTQRTECTLKNAWQPLVSAQKLKSDGSWGAIKPILNDIALGGTHANTMILTGPNGCGKSTILKTVGCAGWFAHCFAIASAEKAIMSFFSGMRTSLNVVDNISEGISTYMASQAAVERIKDYVATIHEKNKGLILCGEPYRGTPDPQTDRKVIEFCEGIRSNKHFIMALETHVAGPTNLAKLYPQDFSNGQMEIKEEANGMFERRFKLLPGAADWWFDINKKSIRFVDWITVLTKQVKESKMNLVGRTTS